MSLKCKKLILRIILNKDDQQIKTEIFLDELKFDQVEFKNGLDLVMVLENNEI